jgi:hypothetical protein
MGQNQASQNWIRYEIQKLVHIPRDEISEELVKKLFKVPEDVNFRDILLLVLRTQEEAHFYKYWYGWCSCYPYYPLCSDCENYMFTKFRVLEHLHSICERMYKKKTRSQ